MVRHLICASLAIPLFANGTWAQTTMAEAGKAAGVYIGAATNSNQLTGTSTYITNLKSQFNMVVCENEMKFQPTENSRGKFSYRGGDGVSDGSERLSGSNPLNPDSMPIDSDRDGLSDDFERAQGTNEYNQDTDNDGASDAVEAALGTNPISRDSDLDGISDGREINNGTDPLIPDTK